mmetsp:Transcript_38616/g.122689  ORF Transcript_38616/g.122689 Transcript_38616/m.122689 type:complete len:95 (+) Transcript_38616:58-342(+)
MNLLPPGDMKSSPNRTFTGVWGISSYEIDNLASGFALTQEGGEDVLLASSPDPAKLRDASAQLLTTPPPPKGGRGLPVASAAPSGGEGSPPKPL